MTESKPPFELKDDTTPPQKMRLIATGGTGMNWGQAFSHPELEIIYVDGSNANADDAGELVHENNTFYIPGLRGAGSNRKLAYEKAKPYIPKIIEQLSPCDFTVIAGSFIGGSGSVISPLLAGPLIKRGSSVIIVGVGTADGSGKGLSNTIETFKSFEGVSAATKAPVLLSYHENQAGVKQSEIDEDVLFVLHALFTLANQRNHGIDVQDVYNWINYHLVIPVHPSLTTLSLFSDRREAASVLEPITTLSLFADRDKIQPVGTPYYSKAGYPRDAQSFEHEQLHFVTSVKLVDDVFQELTSKQTALNRAFSGYRNRKPMVDVDDALDGDGIFIG